MKNIFEYRSSAAILFTALFAATYSGTSLGAGVKYPEPLFAILNFAKITDSPMIGEWVMEVDWVKHERWR
jgi:hypothetical protein